MCLITEQKEPFTADKDIPVWKLVGQFHNYFMNCLYYGSCINYRVGETYTTKMEKSNSNPLAADEASWNRYFGTGISLVGFTKIRKGFHSCNSLERVIMFDKGHIRDGLPVYLECIIPKGGLYYQDDTGLLVSDKITVVAAWCTETGRKIKTNKHGNPIKVFKRAAQTSS